ncbi:hypothetical protein ACFQ9X_04350 [Catenulispora yoronensis]
MTEPEQRPTPMDSGHGTGGGVRAEEVDGSRSPERDAEPESESAPPAAPTATSTPAATSTPGTACAPAAAPAPRKRTTRSPRPRRTPGPAAPAPGRTRRPRRGARPRRTPTARSARDRSAPGAPSSPGPERRPSDWGDPNRYGPVDRRPDPREDPDRRYRDQREVPPVRPERDLRTRWALGLSLGSTACTMLAIYQGLSTFPAWMVGAAAGVAFAVAAFVLSISAQRTAALKHQRASEATASMVSASVSGVLAGLLLVASIVWWTPFKEYAKCMQGANTQVAEKGCLTQLEDRTGMSTSR